MLETAAYLCQNRYHVYDRNSILIMLETMSHAGSCKCLMHGRASDSCISHASVLCMPVQEPHAWKNTRDYSYIQIRMTMIASTETLE